MEVRPIKIFAKDLIFLKLYECDIIAGNHRDGRVNQREESSLAGRLAEGPLGLITVRVTRGRWLFAV